MARYKVDTYIDASISASGSTAFGIYILFNDKVCCEAGIKAQKNVQNPEVAELHALQRGLGKLYGNQNQSIMNSDITVYIDNSSVLDYFTLGKPVSTFPQATVNSCKGIIKNLTQSEFNNSISFKKVESSENKAHDLAYNAATKGMEKKAKSMADVRLKSRKPLVEPVKKVKSVEAPQSNTVKTTDDNSIFKVAEFLKKEAQRVLKLESQLKEALSINIELQRSLNEVISKNDAEIKKYKANMKDALTQLSSSTEQVTRLTKDNEVILSQMSEKEAYYANSISMLKDELDMYKKKVAKLEKQRKLRGLRGKLSKSNTKQPNLGVIEVKDIFSEVAISLDCDNKSESSSVITTENNPCLIRDVYDQGAVVSVKNNRPVFSKILSRLIK